jgi:hypothetical protein
MAISLLAAVVDPGLNPNHRSIFGLLSYWQESYLFGLGVMVS